MPNRDEMTFALYRHTDGRVYRLDGVCGRLYLAAGRSALYPFRSRAVVLELARADYDAARTFEAKGAQAGDLLAWADAPPQRPARSPRSRPLPKGPRSLGQARHAWFAVNRPDVKDHNAFAQGALGLSAPVSFSDLTHGQWDRVVDAAVGLYF